MRRPETPPVLRTRHTDEFVAMDDPVTVRIPEDLRIALSRAAVDDGRPSASDMIRVILYDYLRKHRYLVEERPSVVRRKSLNPKPKPKPKPKSPLSKLEKVPCTATRNDGQPCAGTHHQDPSGLCLFHQRAAGLLG